ncbi:unnamed protein product [Anisakis simplex]|uniref:ANK_REP_REGION domain-containing protein n=1 Tax=Anisakis simplex TaxID=6269 RepID=A0A0M3JTU7_ANISI|nr:unnamed protein product [Anisakis simplex]
MAAASREASTETTVSVDRHYLAHSYPDSRLSSSCTMTSHSSSNVFLHLNHPHISAAHEQLITSSSSASSLYTTAKRLRQRLQRQHSGRRYTSGDGDSSVCSLSVPTSVDRNAVAITIAPPCPSFNTARCVVREDPKFERTTTTTTTVPVTNSSSSTSSAKTITTSATLLSAQNIADMILEAIHMEDVHLVERLLASCFTFTISASPSASSLNEFTQQRLTATTHQHSNASSTHSVGRSTCMTVNILHMAIAHKQRDIVELLLKNGFNPNASTLSHCKSDNDYASASTGILSITSVMPRVHSIAPEQCNACVQLRMISMVDINALGIAIKTHSSELISLLVAYGADVNLADEDGNTPLMLAVQESPIGWHSINTLIMFGARIEQKNHRGICAIDVAPKLRRLQERCVEDLFKIACGNDEHATTNSAEKTTHQSFKKLASTTAGMPSTSTTNSPILVDSTCGSQHQLLSSASLRETSRRKSLVSIQLHRRCKSSRRCSNFQSRNICNWISDIPIETVTWDQAWELLKKMATNPECLQAIQSALLNFVNQEESMSNGMAEATVDKDAFDSHMSGLLHHILRNRNLNANNNGVGKTTRSICSPAHRLRQCSHHCTQILLARLLLFLCHLKTFRARLAQRTQLKSLVQLLEPTLDPQLLCLLLQSIALIALDSKTHRLFVDMQIDDVLIQMLLPADDWYYTNHSTKFGQFVKYHAARILVYVGLGDRVGTRVSLFNFAENGNEMLKSEQEQRAGLCTGTATMNEDDYICETCATPTTAQAFSRVAFSAEGILLKVLSELVKNAQHSGTTEPIAEESPSRTPSPPAAVEEPTTSTKAVAEEKMNQEAAVRSSRQQQQQGEQLPQTQQTSTASSTSSSETLEGQLCKLGLVLDSVLLLRLLLHKLSWDLSLVVKKRTAVEATANTNMNGSSTNRTKTLENMHKQANNNNNDNDSDNSSMRSSATINCHNLTKLSQRTAFIKSKSFDRRHDNTTTSQNRKECNNFLRVDQGSRASSKRVRIRRSSSVELPLRTKTGGTGAGILVRANGTDDIAGSTSETDVADCNNALAKDSHTKERRKRFQHAL